MAEPTFALVDSHLPHQHAVEVRSALYLKGVVKSGLAGLTPV